MASASAGLGRADAVETRDLADDVAGRIPVARRGSRYFSESRYSFAARQRRRLAQLEAAIDAPQAGQRRRQRRADQKARRGRTFCRKNGLMSGVLTNKCGRKKSCGALRRQLGEILGQLAACVLRQVK